MKYPQLVLIFLTAFASDAYSQNTQTSGNWSDPSIWSGGSVPAAGGTVNVNNPVTIDANLSPTGPLTFNSNATDQPGGTAYTFNPSAGTNTIAINTGSTVTFEGGTSVAPNIFAGGTINIFGTLILGFTQINNSGNLNIVVEAGGTLIINGDLTNKNNAGTFTINGSLIVNGNFTNQTGSITVGGTGTISTTGMLTSNGGSTIFGTTNDCTTGPCSSGTLNCTFTNTISPVSKAICSGSSAGNLVSTNTATAPTYQWLSSTDNITFANATGANTNATYTPPALAQTTWYKLAVTSSSGCTSTSAVTKITVLSGGGWLGGTSNDWGTASNWCANAVPVSTTDVTISNAAGIANLPTINAGTAASCRNLTISNTFPASSVTIAASGTASLSIHGDFTNNGTFTDSSLAATAGVILAGSVAQNINGTTAGIFNNLTIDNTSGVVPAVNVVANNLVVNSNLTMTSGVGNLGGNTVTLGTAAASPGTLTFTAGSWLYGGNIERWFPTTVIAVGSTTSLFPIGSATNYRPIYFGSTGLATGGTIKVSHTAVNGSTAVCFLDGAANVKLRSNSFWTVSTGNGITSAVASFPIFVRTEGTGFGLVAAPGDLRLTLVGGAAPGLARPNSGTTANPQVNRSSFSVANLANNFYWGSVNPAFTTLPVVLKSFSGMQESEQATLAWITETEQNFNYFSLERAVDGINYREIARIPGTNRGDHEEDYTYTDKSPSIGANYYRLKLVDLDGSATYSTIVLLTFAKENGLTLFPNPSDGQSITARTNSSTGEPYSIDVFDTQGKTVGRIRTTQPETTFTFTPVLAAGIYFVRFSSGSNSTTRSFLVKK